MSFLKNQPSIRMTIAGFGQAGTRIVDRFAEYKRADGVPVYNTLALNSNDGDLAELRHVPRENRVSLGLGGMGKDPEKGLRVLEENERAKEALKDFVTSKIRTDDSLVLFVAGLGGGTGTSTIIKAIEEFHDYHNNRLLKEALLEIRREVGDTDFRANMREHQRNAFIRVRDKFKKIGVIVTLPTRSDGPDVLRQVNTFATKLWELAKNAAKGVAFVVFADNQMFFDRFQEEAAAKTQYNNYRDFANHEIASIFHEINTATNGGGTSVTFDSNDFRRIVLEQNGCFILNRVTEHVSKINNNEDLQKLFLKSIQANNFHDPIKLEEEDEAGNVSYAKVFHVGLLAIIPPDLKALGSSFIDNAKDEISRRLPLQGTIFSGFLNEPNNYNVSIYTFYKADALPSRLSKGLVKEYEEFLAKQRAVNYKSDSIQKIDSAEDDFEIDIDLAELGIDLPEEKKEVAVGQEDDISLDDFDLEDFDFSNIDPNKVN
ncbi:hypothetical protein J2T17_004392 [Paenibacillus mucilaginosus]|uniref:cell division protein FtsZ n=1 Tax=Paenibacillus mucilaginosus TaxID=61624 RepID=UPI003D1DEEE1